jgi:hypothetical protein
VDSSGAWRARSVPTRRAPSGARGHLDLGLKGLVQTGFDLKSLFIKPAHGKVQAEGTSENWWSRVARGYGLVRVSTGTERRKPGTAGEPVYSDQWDKGRLTLIPRRHRPLALTGG